MADPTPTPPTTGERASIWKTSILAMMKCVKWRSAFEIRNAPLLNEIDISSYWTFSDIFEEGWLSGKPFYGG